MVQALDVDEIQPDLPQALRLIDEMNSNVKQVSEVVGSMLQRVKNGEFSTEQGLSFLEVKYHMLLNYLINLTFVVLKKSSGQKIENDPSIDRLIEIRTVLEKIRPIDYKLRYQIDKLVKTAVTGSSSTSDPLTYKANPGNLMASMAGSSNDETSDEEENDTSYKKKKKSKELDPETETGKYVPPKLTAMHYDDDTAKEKKEKLLEKQKRRAINSTLVDEWKEEFLDTPVEVSAGSRAQQMVSRAQKEKEEYEEKYFTRIPLSKADKHRQKHLSTVGTLGDELTRFNDTREDGDGKSKGRKRKGTAKKRGGKKKKFH